MIILKSVPFGLGHNLARGRRIDDNFVPVDLSRETRAVLLPHLAPRRLDQIGSLSVRLVDKLLGVRRVTDALEELDTLFTLQFLQLAILLDEFLLVDGQFHTFQIVQNRLLCFFVGSTGRYQTSQLCLAVNWV